MAKGWKRAVEVALSRSGVARALGARTHPSALILAYHNIVPTDESVQGDRSLHIDQTVFGAQLDYLMARGRVVALPDLLENEAAAGLRVAITFDDAYRGTMTAGVAELQRRGLPATVFVPPGLLGASGFWWDEYASGRDGLDLPFREHALTALEGDAEKIGSWAAGEGRTPNSLAPHAQPVTEAELLNETLYEAITFGAHTWSHPNLAVVPSDRLEAELTNPRQWLAARTDRYVDWLAYPYGLRSPAVIEAAEEQYEAALLVDGGFARRRGSVERGRHEIPRLNVPRGLSIDGLALRLAGLLS